MITYIRPSGSEITVSDNEANRAYAVANGWEVKPQVSKPEIKKAKAK